MYIIILLTHDLHAYVTYKEFLFYDISIIYYNVQLPVIN